MNHKTLIAVAVMLALGGTAHAARIESAIEFEADTGDMIPGQLVASKAKALPGTRLETQTLHFSWVLPEDQKIAEQQPFVRESKEYWTRVPGAELAKGTTLHTTAKGALIRLSPISGEAKGVAAIAADDVVLSANGRTFQGRQAMANSASDAELKMLGTDFPDGTLAFQLRDDIAPGAITLSLPKVASDYLVHVFEPNSSEVLELSMDRIVASHGQTYKVLAHFNGNESLDSIDGLVSAPNGATFDLNFKRAADGSYVAELAHDALAGEGPGLWEVHAFASAKGASVQRDAKTAFSSSVPRARLSTGGKAMQEDDGSLTTSFKLKVAAESRYEVRATLWGMDGGKLRPAAQASAAAVLAPGNRGIDLVFDAATMAKAGVRGPYQLRDITLIDQVDLGTIEWRRNGLRIGIER